MCEGLGLVGSVGGARVVVMEGFEMFLELKGGVKLVVRSAGFLQYLSTKCAGSLNLPQPKAQEVAQKPYLQLSYLGVSSS